jgi:hypothetical protein
VSRISQCLPKLHFLDKVLVMTHNTTFHKNGWTDMVKLIGIYANILSVFVACFVKAKIHNAVLFRSICYFYKKCYQKVILNDFSG